jgi:alpha-beta hydrolase superfamily lysophospholipase
MIMHISGNKQKLMAILTGLAILALPHAVKGQDKGQDKKSDSSENVKFDSVDGVELRGTFYPASKAKAPPVLMLHRYGGNRQGWEKAAEKLQDKGFAVLTFDFRGHGESTKVSPDFWKLAANANHIRGGNKPDKKTIRQSEFRADYLPMLVNDIAAAKRYLDKQNDAGLCNSSNLILVGAEEGAALGLLWMDSEWDRRPKIQTTLNRWIYDPQGKPYGEDIAAAIWISPTSALNGKSVSNWLRDHKEIREKIPMVFYASKEDASGSAAATKLFDDLKRQGKMDLTFLQIKGGKARGVELVNNKDFTLPDDFKKYLEAVNDKKGINAWKMRDTERGPLAELVPLQRYGFSQLVN